MLMHPKGIKKEKTKRVGAFCRFFSGVWRFLAVSAAEKPISKPPKTAKHRQQRINPVYFSFFFLPLGCINMEEEQRTQASFNVLPSFVSSSLLPCRKGNAALKGIPFPGNRTAKNL